MSHPMPAASSSTGQTTRPRRPVRVWDIVVTAVLLVLLGIAAAIASYFGLFLAMASDGCFDSCNEGMLSFGVWFAVISPWVVLLLALAAAVALLILRRLAFWVPLTGAALTVATFFVAVGIVGAAVGT